MCRAIADGMPLNRFANSQDIVFQIVAASREETWRPATLVCRFALPDFTHLECHAVGDAKAFLEKLPMFTAMSMAVPGNCLRPYTAAERTGIRAELCPSAAVCPEGKSLLTIVRAGSCEHCAAVGFRRGIGVSV